MSNSLKLTMKIVIFKRFFAKMAISFFVYYNVLVHISKTTKDTTSAQENFFVYVFFSDWKVKKQTSSMWFIFLQLFAYEHVQAKCGPGLNFMGWGRFFSSDVITFPINRSWKKNNGKISNTLAMSQCWKVGLHIIGGPIWGVDSPFL